MNEEQYKREEKPTEPPRPFFQQALERLSRTDNTIPQAVRYPKDPNRLVVRNQLVLQLKQSLLKIDDEVVLSGLDTNSEERLIGIKATVRRISHCNPNLVLLEGNEIQYLKDLADIQYSPGRDVPPPQITSSSANDIHYSPGRDVPPPSIAISTGRGNSPTAVKAVSFDAQLRRILSESPAWRNYPIVAVMDTGIDFAYPGTATIPIQHNGGHPMCDTVEPDYIGWDFVNDQNDPYDDDRRNKHGSRIAAIISEVMNNKVRILPLKVISSSGVGTLFDIFCGFEYILSNRLPEKPKVINASWGFYSRDKNDTLTSYMKQLHDQNIWLVNAAGNRGDITDESNVSLDLHTRYPACYSSTCFNVLTITTTTKDPFTAIENYSKKYVNSGVQGDHDGGFPESLDTAVMHPVIIGSSYATPYASAFVAMKYRKPSHNSTRHYLVDHFPNSKPIDDLNDKIDDGRITIP